MLNIKAIKAVQRAKWKTVYVADWGGEILLRPLGVADFIELQKLPRGNDSENLAYIRRVVQACVVDENGQPLFVGDGEEVLNQTSRTVLAELVTECLEVSGVAKKNES